MKNNKLVDAIGMIKDEYIEEAHTKNKFNFVMPWALLGKLATAALVLFVVIQILPFGEAKYNYSGNSYTAYESDGYYAEESKESYQSNQAKTDYTTDNTLVDNSKLILTANMNLETKNLDDVISNINLAISKYGGYVQSSSINTHGDNSRYYDATIRIPADKYKEFLSEIQGSGNVSSYSEKVDDITTEYNDKQARLNSLKAEESRIMEFYQKAESISELMDIEQRLSDIRYEIDYIETQIKNYDLLVAYSTLTIHVSETKTYTQTNTSFTKKLSKAFKNGFSDFISSIEYLLIDLAYNIYSIIILVAIVAAGIIIYKRIRNKKRKAQ